jgi:hypothetical protein
LQTRCLLGMAIRVWVPDIHRVPDSMGPGMGIIFYPRVAPEPRRVQGGYFSHPQVTRYFTTVMILGCEQVKMCSFCDINYDLL